jgi:hypothetical protein
VFFFNRSTSAVRGCFAITLYFSRSCNHIKQRPN